MTSLARALLYDLTPPRPSSNDIFDSFVSEMVEYTGILEMLISLEDWCEMKVAPNPPIG